MSESENKKNEILVRMEKIECYFFSLSETNKLFAPEFECAKKIREYLSQKDRLTLHDVGCILKIYNDTNDGQHYNGSGWLDYRLHLMHLLSVEGFKVEEENWTHRILLKP